MVKLPQLGVVRVVPVFADIGGAMGLYGMSVVGQVVRKQEDAALILEPGMKIATI